MAQSFVPQNTKVICTNMTTSTPQEIKATRSYIVIHTKKSQPLLTLVDNKMSNTFSCKVSGKLWGGFQALCIGIAIGAAIVLTGGLAAAVIITALAVSIVAGGTAIYKMAHDCDATLQVHWEQPHAKVLIQEQKALLHHSTLPCPKGGVVSLIMDPVIAAEAAEQISRNNNEEILYQMGSQMFIGAVGTATAGPGALFAAGITAGLYFPGEWMGSQPNKVVSNAATVNVSVAVTADGLTIAKEGEGAIFNKSVGSLIKGGYQTAASQITGDVSQGLEGAFRIALANKDLSAYKEGSKFNGYGAIGGILANITVGYIADKREEALAEGVEEMVEEQHERDAESGINVISTQK
jgi:hypothetical protein